MDHLCIEQSHLLSKLKDLRLELALNSARPMLNSNRVVAQYEMQAPKVIESTPSHSSRQELTSAVINSPKKLQIPYQQSIRHNLRFYYKNSLASSKQEMRQKSVVLQGNRCFKEKQIHERSIIQAKNKETQKVDNQIVDNQKDIQYKKSECMKHLILKTFQKICSQGGSDLQKNNKAMRKAIERYFPTQQLILRNECSLIGMINRKRQEEIQSIELDLTLKQKPSNETQEKRNQIKCLPKDKPFNYRALSNERIDNDQQQAFTTLDSNFYLGSKELLSNHTKLKVKQNTDERAINIPSGRKAVLSKVKSSQLIKMQTRAGTRNDGYYVSKTQQIDFNQVMLPSINMRNIIDNMSVQKYQFNQSYNNIY